MAKARLDRDALAVKEKQARQTPRGPLYFGLRAISAIFQGSIMNNGERDLSKVVIPNGLIKEMMDNPVGIRAIDSFMYSLIEKIIEDDISVIRNYTAQGLETHCDIEMFMALHQMIEELKAMSTPTHKDGPDCPVYHKLNQLTLVQDTLIAKWTMEGKFPSYAEIFSFRANALNKERTLN
jgi:hypothetical protein